MNAVDSPDVAMAKRLLDDLKRRGFEFARTAPGPDGPLFGHRETNQWVDTIYCEGFSDGCLAWRQRKSLLIVPGLGSTGRRVCGGALSVLKDVATWEA